MASRNTSSREGRARLERALINVYRAGHPHGQIRRHHPLAAERAAPIRNPVTSELNDSRQIPPSLAPALDELLRRLTGIEARLSQVTEDREQSSRASRELYSEWIRLRRWEEMPFAEFLKLRRAGRM